MKALLELQELARLNCTSWTYCLFSPTASQHSPEMSPYGSVYIRNVLVIIEFALHGETYVFSTISISHASCGLRMLPTDSDDLLPCTAEPQHLHAIEGSQAHLSILHRQYKSLTDLTDKLCQANSHMPECHDESKLSRRRGRDLWKVTVVNLRMQWEASQCS